MRVIYLANTIPLEIVIQNFGSHVNTRIPLGSKDERCFITGSSGKGKSHVLEAMQYVLGKKIENSKEFYNYIEKNISGKKEKIYQDHARIELTVFNGGPDYIHKYPKNENLIIGLEAFRQTQKKNRRYIRLPNGIEQKITKKELELFGNWNDPLLFIDDQQTDFWIRTSPKERYEKVSKFIGIENYKKEVIEARIEFKNSKEKVKGHEITLDNLSIRFESIEEKFNRFQEKQKIEQIVENLEKQIIKGKIYENFENFNETQDEFFKLNESKDKNLLEKENLRISIKSNKDRIQKIQNDISSLQKEQKSVQNSRDETNFELQIYQRKLNEINKEFSQKKLSYPEISIEIELQDSLKSIENDILKIQSHISIYQSELSQNKNELKQRENNKIIKPKPIQKLQETLNKAGITNELLFETLEFKENSEDWREYIEKLLDKNKWAVVVNEENRKEAEKINRSLGINTILFYPRKKFAKKPIEELRSWDNLLEINPQKLRKETIIDLMNLMLFGTYFAKDPKEKEKYILKRPFSRIICLDGYIYNIYSQRKFSTRKLNFLIGKGAKEKEIERIKKVTQKLEKEIDIQKQLLHDKEIEDDITTIQIKYISLIKKSKEIEKLKEKKEKIENKLNKINADLSNPEEQIKNHEKDITREKEKRELLSTTINKMSIEIENIQGILNEFSNNYKFNLVLWSKFQEQPLIIKEKEINFENLKIIEEFSDQDYKYLAILDDSKFLLQYIEKPKDSVEILKQKFENEKSSLKGYQDVNNSIIDKYNDTKSEITEVQILLEKYKEETRICEDKFDKTVDNLENELIIWQDNINKKFQTILQGLQLDGKLEFTKDPNIRGNYELSLAVANIVGGSLDPIEETRFSKGEKLRVSIAFEMAILTQSESPFFVWDEFDQNIGDDHRELLAKMIQIHLPKRKLIAISPRRLIKGYIRIFPQIITVWKNDDQSSQVSVSRFEDKVRKQGDTLDALI